MQWVNGPLVSRLKHVTEIWACHKIDSVFREKLVSTAAEKVGCGDLSNGSENLTFSSFLLQLGKEQTKKLKT